MPLEFTPGAKYSYTNSGYILLSFIIEKVSGKSYEDYLQCNILKPLNMDNTGVDKQSMILKNRVSGYDRDDNGLKNAIYIDMAWPSGAGALYSTIDDLYLWDRALYTEKLLSKESLNAMMQPYIQQSEKVPQECYGYGFCVTQNIHPISISHPGNINGFAATIHRFIQDETVIIILSNFSFAPINKISNALSAIVFNKPYEMPKKYKALRLDPKILKNYEGAYKLDSGRQISITREEDHLLVDYKKEKLKLYPESETEFFFKAMDVQISFIKDNDKATGIIWHQGGKDIKGTKI